MYLGVYQAGCLFFAGSYAAWSLLQHASSELFESILCERVYVFVCGQISFLLLMLEVEKLLCGYFLPFFVTLYATAHNNNNGDLYRTFLHCTADSVCFTNIFRIQNT